MYDDADRIDLQPRVLIRAHGTVKTRAKELRDWVWGYMVWQLADYLGSRKARSVRLRPWRQSEIKAEE